ncbi:MAG: hypothetical protein JWR37_234 [Mycobacterium sp.]|nr:hypothetical protein [Mycobacterium sp.]
MTFLNTVTFLNTALRACAAGAVIALCVPLSGCVSTVAGNAVRAQNAAPANVPPLQEPALDDVLLSIGDLNGILGSTQMKVTTSSQEMNDNSDEVSDSDCLGAIFGGEKAVYAKTGWTAVRDEVAREPDQDNDHWVEQTAVLYPSADNARKFVDTSESQWESCAKSTVDTFTDGDSYAWHLGDVKVGDTTISQMTEQQDAGGWGCQHALSAVSNVTVEAWACGYSIKDEGETITDEMVANAAGK